MVLSVTAGCASGGSSDSESADAGGFSVSPTSPWTLETTQGSAPGHATQDYELANHGEVALAWQALSTQPWLTLSALAGELEPGAAVTVTASVEGSAVAALAPGAYQAVIGFEAPASAQEPVVIPVLLTIFATQGALSVAPLSGLNASGPEGGPFAPASKSYTLTNEGDAPFHWSVVFDDFWVSSPDPLAGTLEGGAALSLPIEVDGAYLATLPIGYYVSKAHFLAEGTEVAERYVVVLVGAVTDPLGWSPFTPSADTRVVYVSSSGGDDAADGLSPESPKSTLAAAKALLRDGFPDWLLLKKDDSWDEGFGQWSKSGASPEEPLLIASYGAGNRPRVRPPAGMDAFAAFNGDLHDIALVDLHFAPQEPGTGNAVSWLTGGGGFLVEGCLMEGFSMAVVLQGGGDVAVRRNVMVDLETSGMYVSGVEGLLIEDNVIDRVGLSSPTLFKHGIYLDNEGNTNMVVRGNIVSSTSSHGLQLRPGGVAEDNLFVRTAIALQLGGGDSWHANPGGVSGILRRNVILDGKDIDSSNGRGWGILLQNVASAWVEDNVIANAPLASNPRPIELDGGQNGDHVHDVTLAGNVVYGWGGSSLRVKGEPGSEIQGLVLLANDLQNTVDQGWLVEIDAAASEVASANNRFHSELVAGGLWFYLGGVAMALSGFEATVGDGTSAVVEVAYPNPNVSLAAYNALQGGAASHDAFMLQARAQSKDDWRPEYTASAFNAWARAGFGK